MKATIKTNLLAMPKLFNKNGTINSNIKKMLSVENIKNLNILYPGISCGKQVYCTIYDVHQPNCLECQTLVTCFLSPSKQFSKFCSIPCSRKNKISIDKRAATKIKLYSDPAYNNRPKSNNTNLEKYGSIYSSQNQTVKDKISATLIQNYDKNYDEIIAKKEATFDSRYGCHPNLTPEVQEKKRKDTFKKYGVEHTTQDPTIKKKIKAGTDKYYDSHYAPYLKILNSVDTTILTLTQLSVMLNVSVTVVTGIINKYDIPYKYIPVHNSQFETEVFQFVNGIIGSEDKIISNDREILKPKELDIYLPGYNLAIEVNGIYWHCEKHKTRQYHLDKTINCEKQNIQLLHIFENEWTDYTKQLIWKNIIQERLRLNQTVDAANCILKDVSAAECDEFLTDNHLAGYKSGSTKKGLYYNNELIQLVIFSKAKNKNYDYELIRFSSKKGYTIINGLGKLISTISGSLITYPNRRYVNYNDYRQIGMKQIDFIPPTYFYVVRDKLEPQCKYQKHKLVEKLDYFDPSLSAIQNMYNNGYYRLWDCGNVTFAKDK